MSGENQSGAAAPAVSSETAPPAPTPELVETQSDATQGTDGEQTPAVAKTYTEDELREVVERATAKAAAKAERRAFREANQILQSTRGPAPAQQPVDDRPVRAQGEDDDSYLDRLTDYKLEQRERSSRQQAQQAQHQTLAQKTEKIYAEAEKIPGFDRDEFEALPLTAAIASAITDSDIAPKLMDHMARNPDEVQRIAALSPARQAAEIGKLEIKLSQPVAKPRTAPAPIETVGNGQSPMRSVATANMDEFMKMRAKAGSRWIR